MKTYLKSLFGWKVLRRSCQERYCLFLSLFLHPFLFLCRWLPYLLEDSRSIGCWLENSLIRFLLCVEFLGFKLCGIISINGIFRLVWEFLKSAGKLSVSDNCFVLDSGGFSVWLMLVPCGNAWFVFWSVNDTDLWFDDEWIWFYWSVVEECVIWFSVWDWQDTDLVGCFMNSKMSIYQMFLLRRYCTWDTWKIVQPY